MNQSTAHARNIAITFLLFSGILFAGAAWIEPTSAPPQGDLPTARGGALHRGETFQKKEYGSIPAWGYAGGCPGENAAHPNVAGVVSAELGCNFSRFGAPPISQDSGSIAVRNIYLRDAVAPTGGRTGGVTNKFVDNIYLDATRRGAFHVSWIGGQLADHVITATGITEAVAQCPLLTGTRYTTVLAGCSGSVINFSNYPQQPTAYCSDPENCGFKGAYPVDRSGNYANVNATGCKAIADNDGPSRVVAQAFCIATYTASLP